MSDPKFTGHTELIGELCGVKDVTIMLASDDLIVTHVSTHVSLLEAIRNAKQPRIRTIIQLTVDALRKWMPNPRIAVAGLNPHAGEHGLFGDEEIDEIIPAVQWAQEQGYPVEGTVPSGHSVLPCGSEEKVRCNRLHVSRPGTHSFEAARL